MPSTGAHGDLSTGSARAARPAPRRLTAVPDPGGHPAPTRTADDSRAVAWIDAFAVEVQRRDGVAIVQPRGELDLATVETLRTALDAVTTAERLVLDLRGVSYMDSTGLNLLVALNKRAQRDEFQLALVAPAAPANRAIQVSGLDRALPFVAAADALGGQRRP
jgi:anti-sigma B factor antagonist